MLSDLSDVALVGRISAACLDVARGNAAIVRYLIEVEERRLHLRTAHRSMFDFCIRKLQMTEGSAFRRINAARLVRRFPRLLPALECGELHLSGLVLLRKHLTEANVDELVAATRGKSVRQIEMMVAERWPKPDVRSRILPLSAKRFEVSFTASAELRSKIERARELMRHRNPAGELEVVIDHALDALLSKLEKEILGKVDRPRRARQEVTAGAVSNEARREVFARDGEQCTFEDEEGNRCPAKGFLQLDHIASRSLGGGGTAENLRVRCGPHNRLHAEDVFGRLHVANAIDVRRRNAAQTEDREHTLALNGLTGLGFKRADAVRALDEVVRRRGTIPLPEVLRETIGMLA